MKQICSNGSSCGMFHLGNLIFLSFLLSLAFDRVDTDLFVILLQGGKIFTSLRELSFLHTLSDVPVDESSLGVHQIELVIQTSPGLGDGGCIAQHTYCTLHFRQVPSGNDGGRLVVDTDLEPRWTPVDELDRPLCLDGCNGGIDVLWNDVTSVEDDSMPCTSRGGDHTWQADYLAQSRSLWSRQLSAARGRPSPRRLLGRRWREGNGCVGRGPSWFEIPSNLHLERRRNEAMQ